MSLDPDIAAIIDELNTGFPKVESMTGRQARAAIRARLQMAADPEPVGNVANDTVVGPAGDVPVRIYTPLSQDQSTVVVFAHGGGFVFCDLDSHDALCRSMANGLDAVVVSVDYRLAPEHPWPAAADDVYAVTRWAGRLGGQNIVLAGDSAGGNLAAVTAVVARDRGGPAIAAQVLLYPVIAAEFDTESYASYGNGYFNTRDAMAWLWDQYVPDTAGRRHPYASPARAELHDLPPAVIVTAGFDPLCSEGGRYAQSLMAAAVPTVYRCYRGAIHGFMTMPTVGLGARAREQTWRDVRELLRRHTPPG
jgi:acetyl esterase